MFSAVILTPGRTGSHLIMKNLSKHYNTKWFHDSCDELKDNPSWTNSSGQELGGIIHTHNPHFTPPTANFIAIFSQRADTFSAVCSSLIAKRTREYSYYSDSRLPNVVIRPQEFTHELNYHLSFFNLIDASKYSNVVQINYEDMLGDAYYLFKKFGVLKKLELIDSKSPYDYNQIISNVEQLRNCYNELTHSTN